jgi:hypothetical protein
MSQQQIGPLSGDGTAIPSDNRSAATWALVLGLASLFAWLLPILGLPVSATGLGLGVAGQQSSRRGMAIIAIVLASIGLVLTIVNAGLTPAARRRRHRRFETGRPLTDRRSTHSTERPPRPTACPSRSAGRA